MTASDVRRQIYTIQANCLFFTAQELKDLTLNHPYNKTAKGLKYSCPTTPIFIDFLLTKW